jgi:hypothetical protein
MSEVLELEPQTKLDTAGKRARIEMELHANPNRSDREIARLVGNGVDHKTVGAARERLGIASPLGNFQQPTGQGDDLVAGSTRRVVDIAIASKIPPPPGVVDPPKYDPFAPGSDDLVVAHQPAIAVYENTAGAVVILQHGGADEEDPIILVRPEHVEKLIARLRKVAAEAGR